MKRSASMSLLVFLLASLGCLGCDQLTKEIARSQLATGPISLASGTIQLMLTQNHGAFLSLGASLPEAVRHAALKVGVPIALAAVCFAFLRRSPGSMRELLGLALVVGGGGGNWLDRILQGGSVTDFVRVSVGPLHTGIFNAADVAILLGVALLLGGAWRAPAAPTAQP